MLDTANKSLETLKKRVKGIVDESPTSELAQRAQNLLSAINYEDETLVASSLNSLSEALRALAQDIIRSELTKTEKTKHAMREVWRDYADGVPFENVDELRKELESFIDERIASMTEVRDGLVKALEKRDYPVDNAPELNNGILALQEWKENIVRDWPSSSKPPSPINRQAIDEARAAIRRGREGVASRRADLG